MMSVSGNLTAWSRVRIQGVSVLGRFTENISSTLPTCSSALFLSKYNAIRELMKPPGPSRNWAIRSGLNGMVLFSGELCLHWVCHCSNDI